MSDQHSVTIANRQIWGGLAPFALSSVDRRQHVYVIGKTGTGKSTLLRNMIVQDIEAGVGVGLVDPHGDLAEEMLDLIPSHRVRDVLYFNPADTDFPIGFNLLRMSAAPGHLVASGIVSAFKNVWKDSWGPRLEYILYASVAALTEVENATLLGIPRMLSDAKYRSWVVRQVTDPSIRAFWEQEFGRYDKRFITEAISPIQNKVGQLVMSPVVRNIVGQVRNRVDARSIMDDSGILIANLSKGRLGEDKANLLGSMIVTAFQLAAMSRTDSAEHSRREWHLYVDEFQNFATDSFASILSEARKYRLCLTLSHQHTGQVKPEVRDAVFGNVGTFVSFRVSQTDAQALAREYGSSYSASTFTTLGNFEVCIKAVIDGEQREPFLGKTFDAHGAVHGHREQIVRQARNSFATPREIVEDRLKRWTSNRCL